MQTINGQMNGLNLSGHQRLGHFGRDLSGARNFREGLEMAGLNWEVATGPVQTMVGDRLIQVPDFKTVVRTDTLTPLGVVGAGYAPFQNTEALAIVEDLMNEGGAKMIRGGTFGDGGSMFLSMELPGRMKIGPKQDEVAKYLTIINSHDGSQLFRSLFSPFRLWCSNQIRALLRQFKDNLSIRHTKGGYDKLSEARRSLGAAQKYYKTFELVADKLARTPFSDKQMVTLAEQLFPAKVEEETGKVIELSGKAENNRNKVVELFTTGAGHKETGIVGTAWGAVNAVAEFVDFERNTRTFGDTSSEFARSTSAWFGNGVKMKEQSFEIVKGMVGMA